MARPKPNEPPTETDPRFPSGAWTGFYQGKALDSRRWMELSLIFGGGRMKGEGRDPIGRFRINGTYQVDDGRCQWTKAYIGLHSVAYAGYNEGKGIWGTWEIESAGRGGFHIWPVTMGDPTQGRLRAEVEAPAEVAPASPEPVAAD